MENQWEKVLNFKDFEQELQFNLAGVPLHTCFMPCRSGADTLIVRFHGAINREKRKLPSYQPNMRQVRHVAHQLTICDPTMMVHDGFNMSWYLGHEGFDCRYHLNQFILEFSHRINAKRVVYIGSSGGGFAALHQSYYHPGSLALVVVPQTNVLRYHEGYVTRYVRACWPSLREDAELEQHRCLDMCELYKKGFENTVVFIQSSGDKFHFVNHCVPFLNAATQANADRVISHTDFWGRIKHSGAVPPEGYLPWMQAAISSPTLDADDLLMTWYDINVDQVSSKRAQPTTENQKKIDTRDVRRSDLIRDILLK